MKTAAVVVLYLGGAYALAVVIVALATVVMGRSIAREATSADPASDDG